MIEQAQAPGEQCRPAGDAPTVDIGPLSWVAAEIDATLSQAHEALEQAVRGDAQEAPASLRRARASVHQVHGALQMLELDGVDRVSAALEDLLVRMESGQLTPNAALARVFGQACLALREYLDEVHHNATEQPLRLYPYYRELLEAIGADPAHAAELFLPAGHLQPTALPEAAGSRADSVAGPVGSMQALRQRFEFALLKYLKHTGEAHAAVMAEVLAAVASRQTGQPWHAFWWVMHGFADAVATRQLPHEVATKQLFGRINLQLQRLAKEKFCGNDGVFRDALFHLVQIPAPMPFQQAIRQAFRLDGIVPEDFGRKRYGMTDLDAMRTARMLLGRIKTAWTRIVHGDPGLQDGFVQDMAQLSEACRKLGCPPLDALLGSLCAPGGQARTDIANEALCLEIATGLLVVESALNEMPPPAPQQFAARARVMQARLQAAAEGHVLAPVLAEDFPRTQQSAMHALVEEMQAGLREAESQLEAFFRHDAQADTLAGLAPRLHQIEGALGVLDQDDAVSAVRHAMQVIDAFARGLVMPDARDCARLAQNIGALGLFMEALQCDAGDAKRQFAFDRDSSLFHGRDAGLLPLLPPPCMAPEGTEEGPALASDAPVECIEPAVPADAGSTCATLETQTGAGQSADDAELRLLFVGEARDVLGQINAALAAVRGEAAGEQDLAHLRRLFHTLKGSARMVLLEEFSAAAGELELSLDLQLAANAPAAPGLVAWMQAASDEFSDWLDSLDMHGDAARNLAGFRAAVERRVGPHARSDSEDAGQAPAEPATKQVGDLQITLPLYIIYRAETEELVRLLSAELAAWRAAPEGGVSIRAVHAAHSLAGSSATVGLKPVHAIAFAIEAILQHQVRKPVKIAAYEFDMLGHGIDVISHMLGQFSAGQMPAADPATEQILQRVLGDIDSRAEASLAHAAMLARGEVQAPAQIAPAVVEESASAPAAPQILLADDFLAARFGTEAIDSEPVALHDAHDADLLPVFVEEAQEAIPVLGQTLRDWRRNPADSVLPQSLLRLVHTLKGSARMAGAMRFGQHLHQMEAKIEACLHSDPVAPQVFDELLQQSDRVQQLFEQLCRPGNVIEAGPAADSEAGFDGPAIPGPVASPSGPASLRVRTDVLDRLVNQAGEVAIARAKLEIDIGSLQQALGDLSENVARLRAQLRALEVQADSQINAQAHPVAERAFDALEFDRFTRLQELTRMLAESVDDVVTVQQSLGSAIGNANAGLALQGRLTRALQQDLLQIRMVQFGSIADRLYRVVRQTAKEHGKRVNLDLRGAGLEMDRSVLDRMAAPFEHLLRNAIVHGIEPEDARRTAGKPLIGELQITVRQEGNEVVLLFGDDGAGLDLPAIRARGQAAGLLDRAREATDAELAELIFQPGFSTAGAVTESAGRGIGMDAVRAAAAGLGGTLAISSRAGRGTTVTIRLPLTMAVTQVVLVSVGRRSYALPSILVEQVLELKPEACAAARMAGTLGLHGDEIDLLELAKLLGVDHAAADAEADGRPNVPVIVLKNGRQRIAVQVDAIAGNREAVVKNTGPQLARLPGIAGATVLGSGDIVLIINPLQLVQRTRAHAPAASGDALAPAGARQAVVLVVDDSVTVRRVTQRLLLREGYHVLLAKDGVEALERLQDEVPDIMLVDVEMPRMDGFDLTRQVRGDPRTRTIPIVMITSRTAAKHRDVALGLGVNAYFGKPFQEADLLRTIKRHLLPAASAQPAGD